MKLRKQLLSTFLAVAVLPLLVVSIYLFCTNIGLAFNLYQQNLFNATEIQTDLIAESINRMMVRMGNFADTQAVQDACLSPEQRNATLDTTLSNQILEFTDETLDSISIFALLEKDNTILYSSGSNNDTQALINHVSKLDWEKKHTVCEVPLDTGEYALAILVPVLSGTERVGGFLALYRPDYFLKTISSHKQMEGSNSFLYCPNHHKTVTSKQNNGMSGILEPLEEQIAQEAQGALTMPINGKKMLCYYRTVPKTPWVLVNSIPTAQIFSLLWDYSFASVILLLASVGIIFLLSSKESRKILNPLENLLNMVERFFISGAESFSMSELDPKTEIGYLAAKFSGISNQAAAAQSKLRESNYLYQTLLTATYELRITLCFVEDEALSSSAVLTERLREPNTVCAAERVLRILLEYPDGKAPQEQMLRDIVTGHCQNPTDIELCCRLDNATEPRWYRMFTVPIVEESGTVKRVVLHFEDINEKKQKEFHLIRSSTTDPLCGLLNKNAFLPSCTLCASGVSDAFFFIDLDCFKQVNDLLGHAVGDQVLVETANVLRAQFRNSDVLGRYGGDEFVVFVPNVTRLQAENCAKRLVEALSFDKQDVEKTISLHISASVGVCILRENMDLAQFVIIADEAMYHAKQNGKAQYYITEGGTALD